MRGTHGEPPPCTEQPIGAQGITRGVAASTELAAGEETGGQLLGSHSDSLGEVPPFCWTGLVNIVNSMHVG